MVEGWVGGTALHFQQTQPLSALGGEGPTTYTLFCKMYMLKRARTLATKQGAKHRPKTKKKTAKNCSALRKPGRQGRVAPSSITSRFTLAFGEFSRSESEVMGKDLVSLLPQHSCAAQPCGGFRKNSGGDPPPPHTAKALTQKREMLHKNFRTFNYEGPRSTSAGLIRHSSQMDCLVPAAASSAPPSLLTDFDFDCSSPEPFWSGWWCFG